MEKETQFLETPKGKIAYYHHSAKAESLTVMFLHGFFSSMNKTKGLYLRDICREQGYGFLSLDYSGHGRSMGIFEEGCLSEWLQDCQAVIKKTAPTQLVLVGSSMGGWMMIHLALRFPQLVKGLIGIAVAPDFTVELQKILTPLQCQDLKLNGQFLMSSDYQAAGVPITQKLLEDGDRLAVLEKGEIDCDIPIRLLHGIEDKDCPYQLSIKLMQVLKAKDVEVTLVKEGDHSLSTPPNLALLKQVLLNLIRKIEA